MKREKKGRKEGREGEGRKERKGKKEGERETERKGGSGFFHSHTADIWIGGGEGGPVWRIIGYLAVSRLLKLVVRHSHQP